jgi:hypothetical protein
MLTVCGFCDFTSKRSNRAKERVYKAARRVARQTYNLPLMWNLVFQNPSNTPARYEVAKRRISAALARDSKVQKMKRYAIGQ